MQIEEFLSEKIISFGALLFCMVGELVGLLIRRMFTNKEHDCKNCKRWECEGKWCYYKYKK